jgi:hypothetical protein
LWRAQRLIDGSGGGSRPLLSGRLRTVHRLRLRLLLARQRRLRQCAPRGVGWPLLLLRGRRRHSRVLR